MAAGNATVWVFGATSREVRLSVPSGAIVQDVKDRIWPTNPFEAGCWAVFPADEAGNKREGAEELRARQLFPAAPGSTEYICVVRTSATAAGSSAGGAAAGGASGGAVDLATLLDTKLAASEERTRAAISAEIRERLREQLEAEEASAVTPAEYEEAGRDFLRSACLQRFGLAVPAGFAPRRVEGELVMDAAGRSLEWDFRAPVSVAPGAAPHPNKDAELRIYPDQPQYLRPAAPARPHHLTPTKVPGQAAPPLSDFIAVFEVTTDKYWANPNKARSWLLPRLEERLRFSYERARSQPDCEHITSILDVVAVVGVVGRKHCEVSVSRHVTRDEHPVLHQLMEAGRFVFLNRAYTGPGEGVE